MRLRHRGLDGPTSRMRQKLLAVGDDDGQAHAIERDGARPGDQLPVLGVRGAGSPAGPGAMPSGPWAVPRLVSARSAVPM